MSSKPSAFSDAPSTALARFSTCELSDALIKLGVSHGGHIPDVHCVIGPSEGRNVISEDAGRLCGPAYTVQMVMAKDSSAPRLDKHFVDTIEQGSVVVIDVPSGALSAAGYASYY